MKYSIVILLFALQLGVQAQTKKKPVIKNPVAKTKVTIPETKIQLGEKEYTIKGTLFNELVYKTSLSYQQDKYTAYQYTDMAAKTLVITEVYYEVINTKPSAMSVTVYKLPISKLSKKGSYILEMEDENLDARKYYRLTLLSDGINQNSFTSTYLHAGDEKPAITQTTSVTINIIKKIDAENYLKQFTQL